MRPGVTIALTAVDRRRLGAIIGNRNVPQKHAWRAEIVLLTADGLGTVEIMRRTGKSKTRVWRWQERFAAEGVDGLLRDKTRPPRVPPLGQEVIDQVVALTRDRAAARDDPLDRSRDGQGGRRQRLLGPAHLAGAWLGAASRPPLQALQRSRLRAQAPGRRRPLCRPAGACRGVVDR